VLNGHAATQTHHVRSGVTALDAFPAWVGRPVFFEGGDLLFTAQLLSEVGWHGGTPEVKLKSGDLGSGFCFVVAAILTLVQD
jgi:hypothetical protein